MRKIVKTLIVTAGLVLATATAAFAAHTDPGDRTGWAAAAGNCSKCHADQTKHTSGPHGGYGATTNRCMTCHGLHDAANDYLLPGATVVATCNYCHDLTQEDTAPYFTSYMTAETDIKSAHKVTGLTVYAGGTEWDNDLVVPGGSDIDGGNANLDASAQGGLSTQTKFTCDSCHTPHAVKGASVEPYLGESHIKFETGTGYSLTSGGAAEPALDHAVGRFYLTDRILKAKLNGVSTFVYNKYDSNWCAGCHKGRIRGGAVHNHPVALTGVAADANDAQGYQYLDYLAAGDFYGANTKASIIAGAKYIDGTTGGEMYTTYYWATPDALATMGGTVTYYSGTRSVGVNKTPAIKKDPRTNKHYTMTAGDPLNNNAARPDGYSPITNYPDGPSCQQCHGSARNVELGFLASLEVNGGHEAMTFPHVSTNTYLLVENKDDFCTNCHGLDNLP